jgi:FdhE protein
MTRDAWLAAHPYLQPVADLHAVVDTAVAEISLAPAGMPNWDDYVADFHAGVPLVQSPAGGIELSELESGVRALIGRLASQPLPGTLSDQCQALNSEVSERCQAVKGELWSDLETPVTARPGLFRYLGCTVLARYLSPVVGVFARWRDEERWLRNYCPTCGEPPAMGQLIGKDPGRLRFLSCGCCKTRWRYRRTCCPFCDSQDEHRLSVLALQGEEGLRIDYCEACRGYLKTYNGEGNEHVLLADWTSLHLDQLARDRGLRRLAASLYEL